jgi:hypothetical protein
MNYIFITDKQACEVFFEFSVEMLNHFTAEEHSESISIQEIDEFVNHWLEKHFKRTFHE